MRKSFYVIVMDLHSEVAINFNLLILFSFSSDDSAMLSKIVAHCSQKIVGRKIELSEILPPFCVGDTGEFPLFKKADFHSESHYASLCNIEMILKVYNGTEKRVTESWKILSKLS